MRKKILLSVFLLVIVFALVRLAISSSDTKNKSDLYRQVELFSDTLAIIQEDYVDEAKPKEIIYGALKGMLSSLDPHSQFLDPDTYNELKVDTEGKFGGLGIEITVKDGLLTVVTPIEDTPAWKVGLKANDRIVKINDELTRDMTLIDAVKKLRGKPGETVRLSILRESENKILEFKVERDIIKIKDIKEAKILEDGIGYIRIVEFRENTPREVEAAIENLKKAGLSALIIDLRNNPGGLLDTAAKVAGEFLEKGKLIVYTKGRTKEQAIEFLSQGDHPLLNVPLAVLINEGSASGSEVVTGALQDYKRAIIVGVKSFGKGSVQTIIPLSDGSALKLTTAKYYTPLGRQIHEKGIVPDITVEETKTEATGIKKEEALPEKPQELFKKLEEGKVKPKETFDYKSDNQLIAAMGALKAIIIYKNTNVK